jgi:hypothetical protein
MYHTPEGNRILLDAERLLFSECAGMIVDMLDEGYYASDFQAFEELPRNQKLAVLYRAVRALLHPSEKPPKLTAFLEAAVASVYQFAKERVRQEIVDPLSDDETSWRRLVLEAAHEQDVSENLPEVQCDDPDEWEWVIESLADRVLWDQDYALTAALDATPEKRRQLQEALGVAADYFTDVPPDPPEAQINLYIDALRGLTQPIR